MTRYTDVPGWGNFLFVYRELLSAVPENGNILEIGAGFGRGTWTLLDSMKDGMTLFVVDSFKIETTDLWENFIEAGHRLVTLNENAVAAYEEMTKICTHKEMFLHNVSQHVRYAQLQKIYHMTSKTYMLDNNRRVFDLVFLDGNHSYETVKEELEYFKNSSIISGHDYNNETWPGVVQAVNEFVNSNSDRYLKVYKENEVFSIFNLPLLKRNNK
jgi:hypothetical protein